MKSGKEVKLKIKNKNFKAIAGAVENYKAPTSIYVNISSWLTLKKINEDTNADFILNKFSSKVKRDILNKVREIPIFESDSTIIDFDLSSIGIINGRPTFLSLEINLSQKDGIIPLVKLKNEKKEELLPYIIDMVNYITNFDYFKINNDFNFSLKKNG